MLIIINVPSLILLLFHFGGDGVCGQYTLDIVRTGQYAVSRHQLDGSVYSTQIKELETRISRYVDTKFQQQELKFKDLDAKMDAKFQQQELKSQEREGRMNAKLQQQELKFKDLDTKMDAKFQRQELESQEREGRMNAKFQQQEKLILNITAILLSAIPETDGEIQQSAADDCAGVLAQGNIRSDIYSIFIEAGAAKTKVFCDMSTDSGGWLVIQRRQNGVVNFTRTWAEYSNGFGNLRTEFWLGNENLHQLTRKKTYRLRFDLEDKVGEKRFAEYQNFYIDSASEKYRISFSGFSGDAGDSLSGHNGSNFTTIDRDNDKLTTGSCATLYRGGWWYNQCHSSNLNGVYGDDGFGRGLNWYSWHLHEYSLKFTEMKIKPM